MSNSQFSPSEVDYRDIEANLLDAPYGAWFLAEHARRSRRADTERLLATIANMEQRLIPVDHINSDLTEVASLISLVRAQFVSSMRCIECASANHAIQAMLVRAEDCIGGIVSMAESLESKESRDKSQSGPLTGDSLEYPNENRSQNIFVGADQTAPAPDEQPASASPPRAQRLHAGSEIEDRIGRICAWLDGVRQDASVLG